MSAVHVPGRLSRFWMWSVAAVPLCALVTTSCAGPNTTLVRIRRQGFLRAGYAQEAPYSFVDDTGAVVGESPAALRSTLGAIGVDSVRWVRLNFDKLIPALLQGRIDVIASGLFITPGRTREVTFSRPTICARPALLGLAGAPRAGSLADFARPGSGSVAVVSGSVERTAAAILGIPSAYLLIVPDVTTGVAAVRAGHAYALASSEPVLADLARGDSTLVWWTYQAPTAVDSLVNGCSALAVRPEDANLLRLLDSVLDTYVGSPHDLDVLRSLGLSADQLPKPNGGHP